MNLSENIKAVQSMPSWEKAESSFMTSLDIVQEVMNVPMCALTSLLRSYGYDSIDDTSSLCIDEKRLEIFADAYVRKIRSYFTSSLRNISKLSQKELEVLEQFIKLFKNKDLQKEPSKWSDIDTEHLKEAFIEKVRRKTPFELSAPCYIDLAKHILVVASKKIKVEYHSVSTSSSLLHNFAHRENINEIVVEKEQQILDIVTHSYYYVAKSTYLKPRKHINIQLKKIYIAARYHIFVSESEDENSNINPITC